MDIKKNLIYVFLNVLAFFGCSGLGLALGGSGHDMGLGVFFAFVGIGIVVPFLLSLLILKIRNWFKQYLLGLTIHCIFVMICLIIYVYISLYDS